MQTNKNSIKDVEKHTTTNGFKMVRTYFTDGSNVYVGTGINPLTGREYTESSFQDFEGDDYQRISNKSARAMILAAS